MLQDPEVLCTGKELSRHLGQYKKQVFKLLDTD